MRQSTLIGMSPILVVPKKNGKLRVCVNLKKVSVATIRNNYTLPIIKHMLERVVTRKEDYSFLDGFYNYNQVSITLEDQYKAAITTKWGIFVYSKGCYVMHLKNT